MTTSIVPTLRTLSRALLGYDLKTSIRSQGRLISARILSTESEATREQLERIHELFVEARDELEFAKEDLETTYFNESLQDAKKLVEETLGEYRALLESLEDKEEAGRIQRSMGMKMEQLKAELEQLEHH